MWLFHGWYLVATSITWCYVQADFIYVDFNHTLGLNINGDAATSGCNISEAYEYISNQGDGSKQNDHHKITDSRVVVGQEGGLQTRQSVTTNANHVEDDQSIHEMEARFGHRIAYVKGLNTGCKRRLRLTPSAASKTGSVFYEKRLPVVSCMG